MMENSYEQGFAFILEAATELAFYDILLNFLAERHPECKLEKRTSDEIYEPFYVVQGPFGTRVIRMNAVGTITQIKNSVHWFQNTCIHAKGKKIPWTVFLCYDTDSYNADITKFYEDDWKNFRKEISKGSRTVKIIDLAASAEIEDVFLLDLHGISQFLGLEEDLKPELGVAQFYRIAATKEKKLLTAARAYGLSVGEYLFELMSGESDSFKTLRNYLEGM